MCYVVCGCMCVCVCVCCMMCVYLSVICPHLLFDRIVPVFFNFLHTPTARRASISINTGNNVCVCAFVLFNSNMS